MQTICLHLGVVSARKEKGLNDLCILAVPRKRERSFALRAKSLLPDLILGCTFPCAERLHRRHGAWLITESPLFPGYILAETGCVEALAAALRTGRIPGVRFAGSLSSDEHALLESIMEPDGLVRLSRGRIEHDRLLVHAGPLSGLEDNVLRIDRHKRTALVAPIGERGGSMSVLVGLEVVTKTHSEAARQASAFA